MSRRLSSLAGTLLLVVMFGAWFSLFRPVSLGGPATWIVIRGSSMLPTYDTGDLVVMHAASAYSVGDIVAYRVPSGEIGEGHVVVHRLVGGSPDGFEAVGDNNDALDPWLPTSADILGRPWITLPGVGRVITWLHQPAILAALATAVMVSLLVGRTPPSDDHERRRRRTAPETDRALRPS